MRHRPPERAGHGLLRLGKAVTLARRRRGELLAGFPTSGGMISADSLRELGIPVTVASDLPDVAGPPAGASDSLFYLGTYAPQARSVSLVGPFNRWQPARLRLEGTETGWWYGVFCFPRGTHLYRFWVMDGENPARVESGFGVAHSVIG